MALTAPAITGAIIAAQVGTFPGSQSLPKIAQAVGLSLPSWIRIPTNALSLGAAVGIAGVGTVQGKMGFVPTGQVILALKGAGMNGSMANGVGAAVEAGVAVTLNATAQYAGVSPSVGVGADASKIIVSNPGTLIPILLSNLQASGINGQQATQLSVGLGNGIAALVATGFGFGGVVGVGTGVSGAGATTSVVF